MTPRGLACVVVVARITSMMLAAVVVALAMATSACVTIYEPLGGLQKPVVLDVHQGNFEATKIYVRCIPNQHFSAGDANELCRRVSALFTNQGAEVETNVPADANDVTISFSSGKPDLVVDLASRQLADDQSGAMLVLACMTCFAIPTRDEQTYIQEITISDGEGSVLATQTLKARFINYTGCATYGFNWLIDVLFRPKEDQLTGDGPMRDYSRDLYGQLSQTAFNALVRTRLMNGGGHPNPKPLVVAKPAPPAVVPAPAPLATPSTSAPAQATPTPTPAPPPAPSTTPAPPPPQQAPENAPAPQQPDDTPPLLGPGN